MIFPRLKLWLVSAAIGVALVAAVLTAWRFYLIEGERARAAEDAAREFQNTTEAISNADTSTGDPDDDLLWLSDRLHRAGGQR